ncbi:MAG: hypothetical protein QOJ38_1043, partial [Solirubrobacterales bacterium]|nr:hypothetical protein [Solirubrobacterales bacterium]
MGRTGERARIGAIALLVVGTAILGTTVARADDPVPTPSDPTTQIPSDPGKTCADQTAAANPGAAGCDNPYTPIAKEGSGIGWTQVAGAVFPGAPHPGYDPENATSRVPVTVNFYSVSFVNQHNGLAAGAQCKDDPPAGADLESFLAGCVRVPVIYRYTDNTELGPVWQEAYRSDKPGYVGAITWLRNVDTNDHGQRALAVGGDGRYVDREQAFPDDVAKACEQGSVKAPERDLGGRPPSARQPLNLGDPVDQGTIVKAHDPRAELADCEDRWRQANDPAGKGRAWLLSDGSWDEQDVPEQMRGMQALDASPRPDDCPGGSNECAFAGALQQIWIWKNGGFDPLPWRGDLGPDRPSRRLIGGTGTSPSPCTTAAACDWHFRVRGIRFKPTIDSSVRGAGAVTAGCCSAVINHDPVRDGGRSMSFDPGLGAWVVTTVIPPGQDVTIPDSLYAITYGKYSNYGVADCLSGSLLISPGGPGSTAEPGPQIIPAPIGSCTGIDPTADAQATLRGFSSSSRLVAGDGDFQTEQPNFSDHFSGKPHRFQYPGGDDLMDWAVGGRKDDGRALAYTTTRIAGLEGSADAPYPLDCPSGSDLPGGTSFSTKCRPADPLKLADGTKSGALLDLSSYFLRGFTFAGNSGVGWGVGDRGAIERLAGNDGGAGGSLPPEVPPALGAKRGAAAPDSAPYRASAPSVSHDAGAVPALAAQQSRTSPRPRATPYGSPNPDTHGLYNELIGRIAMSRDGTEGWATSGPLNYGDDKKTTLYHFDGSGWHRCGFDSLPGAIRADPACAALAPLAHSGSGINSGVKLTAIARIPTEFDSDPNNDNDFEAIAIGRNPPGVSGPKPLIRYRDGRWKVDTEGTRQLGAVGLNDSPTVTDISFSSPDDGWIHGLQNGVLGLFHFDGTRWETCGDFAHNDDRRGCDDLDGPRPLLPSRNIATSTDFHLSSAGDRIYFYGTVALQSQEDTRTNQTGGAHFPLILYRDRGACDGPGDPGCWHAALNPRSDDPSNRSSQGDLLSLSVARGPDGSYTGWGLGFLSPTGVDTGTGPRTLRARKSPVERTLFHSDASGAHWEMSSASGAAGDYLVPHDSTKKTFPDVKDRAQVVSLGGLDGSGAVFIATAVSNPAGANGPVVWRDPSDGRWKVLGTPFPTIPGGPRWDTQAAVAALAPDNQGGIWVAADPALGQQAWFYRFSNSYRPELFNEVSHPIREQVTAAAGGADGSLWVATNTDAVYRYDRMTGWDRMHVPGWDPGRVVTNPSPAYAIAVGADGSGVMVGRNGRIADLSPNGAVLDSAAGILCSKQATPTPPCGTGRTLRAAAVSPSGSALVGGEDRALLYRSGGTGDFHAVTPPPTAVYSTLTAISFPTDSSAWVTTSQGEVFAGESDGTGWRWRHEDEDRFGDSISRDIFKKPQILYGIAVDASGHGYAVGDEGTVLERTGSGNPPWRRLDVGQLDDLQTVTLGPGGHGALIGGSNGLILTETNRGRFEVARMADHYRPSDFGYWTSGSRSVGLAALGGYQNGELEAWDVTSVANDPSEPRHPLVPAVLHYSSNPDEPLLSGDGNRAGTLRDAPLAAREAITFAAFGNSNCQYDDGGVCSEMSGTNYANEATAAAIRDEIISRSQTSGGPAFSLWTGDVGDVAGAKESFTANTPLDESPIHNRWADLIGGPLSAAGVPAFGAVGERDTARIQVCDPLTSQFLCTQATSSKTSLAWRQSMSAMPAPWGAPGAAAATSGQGLHFEPVDTGGTKAEIGDLQVADPTAAVHQSVQDPTDALPDQTVQDPTRAISSSGGLIGDKNTHHALGDQSVGGPVLGDQKIPTGGAHTHYALDIKRDGKALMRLVVLDTSLKSLAAADP